MNLAVGAGALVMCTRNRPSQLAKRLLEFSQFRYLPVMILVVDSSTNDETQKCVHNMVSSFPTSLSYLHAKPGLPRQRNEGVEWLRENVINLQVIHFLDDDIVVQQDYFQVVAEIFTTHPKVIAVGGYDETLDKSLHSGGLRRKLGLGSSASGVILKSGIGIPPVPTSPIYRCQWLVGGMQSIHADVFNVTSFDSKLRMYGEDLEFYLKVSTMGDIVCSDRLPVQHLNDPSNRDSPRHVQLFHNGVRWYFAAHYPDRVNRWRVVLAALALGIGETLKFLTTFRHQHLGAAIGNFEFLFRLVAGKSSLQVVADEK